MPVLNGGKRELLAFLVVKEYRFFVPCLIILKSFCCFLAIMYANLELFEVCVRDWIVQFKMAYV